MLNNVALIYRRSGRQKAAEPYYLHALELYEKQLGPEHADVASVLNNLGVFYTNERRFEEAEQMHLRALAIRRKGAIRTGIPISRNPSAIWRSFIIRAAIMRARASFTAIAQGLGRDVDKPPKDYEIVASNYADLLRSLGKARKAQSRGSKNARGRSAPRLHETALAVTAAAGNLQAALRDAHVAEWQTRTAQDRMGKPVEVRLLS